MFSVVLVFLFCVFLRGGLGSASCEAGWKKDPDSNTCLKFFPAKQSWSNARNSCLRQNSILVAVHSRNSNDFITKNITGGIRTWIGLHIQNSTRDDWRWSSVASPVDFLNWADGEPNNHLSLLYGSEECVEIEDSSGEWNDENCDSLRPYVCQKSLGCAKNLVEGYSDNTTLASTGDQLTTKSHCMIGYRSDKRTVNATCQADSKWAIDKFHCSEIHCSDPRTTSLHNGRLYIDPGQGPYSVGARISYNCELGFTLHGNEVSICRDIDESIPFAVWDQPPICLKSPTCDPGWLSYNNYCYHVVEEYMEWHDADIHCQHLGPNPSPWARLASITLASENRMIMDQLMPNSTERIWIGLHDVPEEGVWEWTDNSAVSWKNWAPDEPNNGGLIFIGNEDCVEMNLATGLWNDEDCDRRRKFVCEKFVAN